MKAAGKEEVETRVFVCMCHVPNVRSFCPARQRVRMMGYTPLSISTTSSESLIRPMPRPYVALLSGFCICPGRGPNQSIGGQILYFFDRRFAYPVYPRPSSGDVPR
jgi:hypothetical protein